ncbi:MAG: formylglycine-generating enzyme family protein [Planctomycetota bacterium]
MDLGGGVKMELVLIPAGEFLMGSPESEKDRTDFEGPQHRVRISKPFYLGKYEVSQAQWQAVMGNNPSWYSSAGGGKDQVSGVNTSNHPVEGVSWDDCQAFCQKLSAKPGKAIRLPTEAEWEYACRAGSTGQFCFGDSDGQLGEYGWYAGNSGKTTHAVKGKKPNAWGLYDMHGNVWEWCQEWYGAYPPGVQVDPNGPSSGVNRVLRGGSCSLGDIYCRSACRRRSAPPYRGWLTPDFLSSFYGFRVVVDSK